MGRKPTPVSEHILKGTFRKDRHAKAGRAERTGIAIPECPSWITGAAKEAWESIGELLDARRVLTVADGVALALLCQNYADFVRLRLEVIEEGEVYETETASGDKMLRPNPKVAFRDNTEKRLRASLVDFGLNPSARSKIDLPTPVSTRGNRFAQFSTIDDPIERALCGPDADEEEDPWANL